MFVAAILHVLSAVIWVGGMFFAYQILRPVAAELLESPQRLSLWLKVFDRFFVWVQVAIVLLFISGLWMIFRLGGFGSVGWHIHLMLLIALIMVGLFHYVKGVQVKALRGAVSSKNWAAGGECLAKIRRSVRVNLILGLIVVAIASGGRHLI